MSRTPQAILAAAAFIVLASCYSLKKRFRILTLVSPVINGGLKASLVAGIPEVTIRWVVIVLVVLTIRNLFGDIRDAKKDWEEGVISLPVRFGYRRHTPLIYPLAVYLTSILWTVLGHLGLLWLITALAVETLTYRLTPR
jgi:4-hydroxybenzoate polyprenyltransferase